MKKVIFLIFFALCAVSIATVQSVKGVSLDAFSARPHEEGRVAAAAAAVVVASAASELELPPRRRRGLCR